MNRILKEFKVLGKKGEGTFSEVLKCQSNKDQKYYACKKMKHTYANWEQVNALREIQAMRRLSPHPFIVQLVEFVFDKRSGSLVLVLELMDMNLYEFIRGRRHFLPETKVQAFMWQMMRGIDHMHRLGIFHRDVKPENLLIRDDRLKLADFGSCRSVKTQPPFTEYISTRWYRAPECLLTDGYYGAAMDIWSAGCVVYEITSLRPLFPGSNEVDQIAKIHDVLGTPASDVLLKFKGKSRHVSYNFAAKRGSGLDSLMGNATPQCAEAVRKMLEYDPDSRPTAKSVLKLPYFREFRPKGELAGALQQYLLDLRQRKTAAAAGITEGGVPGIAVTSNESEEGKENATTAAATAAAPSAALPLSLLIGKTPSPVAIAAQQPSVAAAAAARGKITPVLESPAARNASSMNKFNAKELQQQRLRHKRQLYGQQQQQQPLLQNQPGGSLSVSFPALSQHQSLLQQQHQKQAAVPVLKHAALIAGTAALGLPNQSLSKQQQFYNSSQALKGGGPTGGQSPQMLGGQQQQPQQQQRLFMPRGQLPTIKHS